MGQPVVQADIVCTGLTAQIGDSCTIDLGEDADHGVVMTGGIVKKITQKRPGSDFDVTVYDILTRAVDHFIASDTPESPYTVSNRKAELLVGDLLALAGITAFTYDATIFTFGTDPNNPTKINLISPWNFIEHINRVCGFTTFADTGGSVQFRDRKPYIVGGDVSEHTFTTGASGDILEIEYLKSDEGLRNRVVVYGAPGITKTVSAVSPFLPSGFFKTLVVAHEGLIVNQQTANDTADVNLTMFNRLTETVRLKSKGIRSVRCRDVVDITEAFTGFVNAKFIVFAANHVISPQGVSSDFTL